MRRIGRSAALAVVLPLLGLVPAVGLAQVYQPTPPPGVAPAAEVVPPPAPVTAPGVTVAPGQMPGAQLYTPQQLDQMLAPIALYPDSLLTQILMASTFPTQIVEANNWLQDPRNAAIHGDMLVAVLTPLQWDPSVKSVVPFPQLVRQMNDNLDWTQSLGTAFATQQADVMAQVQALRAQAAAAGTLVSTPQLRVTRESTAWVIEPADPALVYIPVYNPTLVFGRWAYVDYPPVYFAPEPGFFVGDVGPGIGFSVGFGVVGPLWGWGHPSWGGGTVVVNNAYYSRISYNHTTVVGGAWRHEGGVNLVHSAGFHAPGAGPGGFHAAAAGFHGAPAAGGFHGGPAAGGFHGPAGNPGFHGPANTGFHAPAAAGGFHGGPTSSGGYHAPGGGVSHPQPAVHAPASGGYHPPGGGVSHPQPAVHAPASGGYHPPGGGVSRPQPAVHAPAGGGFHPPGGGGVSHPQPAAHGPAPAAHAPAPHAAPSGGHHR